MFSKPKPNTPTSNSDAQPTRKQAPPSILSSDLHVIGNLESEGDIQIDGQVDGDIRSKQVTIGDGAVVNGAVMADKLFVSGTVNGEITAKKVELTSSARVTGDINHDTLQIEAGAYLQGLCRRIGEQVQKGNGADKSAGGKQDTGTTELKPAATILETGKTAAKASAG